MDASSISTLLGLAVLLPLASFFTILCLGNKLGKSAAYISIGAIMGAAILSFLSLFAWLSTHWPADAAHAHHGAAHGEDAHAGDAEHAREEHEDADESEVAAEEEHEGAAHAEGKPSYYGEYYLLGKFGELRLSIGYYIDALTLTMFCMVTLIASCIHWYATGYMHEELHEVVDHEVTDSHGHHLHRPGRFPRFFQYLSLFCFSMLGLVLAGNIAMVFVFWELVGICSYFLIGFYIERKSASTAANKAFIVNRVGDFGMIIGLMALWAGLGTFAFGDLKTTDAEGHTTVEPGMFTLVRGGEGGANEKLYPHAQVTPVGMIQAASERKLSLAEAEQVRNAEIEIRRLKREASELQSHGELERAAAARASIAALEKEHGEPMRAGYWLLIIGGIGIFCGCVGKSAQFPLHTWLPDAMEGPTPVSALVHSATMVAAGVYLVGRFYPMFTPEVLLVIATIGCITLFLAATIAITATDIKRVLAYSTVSQLGYMMLALGVGGWTAGLLHLITHAFFKSLLFLCSGSVIHAVHTNEMPQMGGLIKKMPITAFTMLIGCLAIIGASIPFVIGFSGYYSKDAILEQAFSFMQANESPLAGVFFFTAAGGAAITAFYMFRLWFMTFLGKPRDHHRYDHAHESPKVMYVPLLILAFFAITVAWSPPLPGAAGNLSLVNLLEQARPEGVAAFAADGGFLSFQGLRTGLVWPNEFASHEAAIKIPVTLLAFAAGLGGVGLAAAFYWFGYLDPGEVRKSFAPVYRLLIHKWYFDELYNFIFVKPVFAIARLVAGFDRGVLDWLIDRSAWGVRWFAQKWEFISDQIIVDGFVNLFANWTYSLALSFRTIQTGRLRQYVMFIVLGTVMVLVLISVLWNPVAAEIPAIEEPVLAPP